MGFVGFVGFVGFLRFLGFLVFERVCVCVCVCFGWFVGFVVEAYWSCSPPESLRQTTGAVQNHLPLA